LIVANLLRSTGVAAKREDTYQKKSPRMMSEMME
jgi:hypothetical protein